jgi:hypothetical protein
VHARWVRNRRLVEPLQTRRSPRSPPRQEPGPTTSSYAPAAPDTTRRCASCPTVQISRRSVDGHGRRIDPRDNAHARQPICSNRDTMIPSGPRT